MDVRAQAEDLGNDHVMVNTQGIENLKYLCEHPDVWNVTDKMSLRVLQGRYESGIGALYAVGTARFVSFGWKASC